MLHRKISLTQVHGNKIIIANQSTPDKVAADGLITTDPNLILIIHTADCFPVFLSDPVNQVVGLLHIGWRGADTGIHRQALKLMSHHCHSDPQDIIVRIGPGICARCYTFEEKPQQSWGKYVYQQQHLWHVDLAGYISSQLLALGIAAQHIHDQNICTYEDPHFPSHRRSRDTHETEKRFISSISVHES